MRISILSINYAPEQTGIAPYTTELAQHLAAWHEVSVFTGTPHYPDWTVDPEWPRARRTVRQQPHLLVQHYRHYVPSKQDVARRALYEASWALQAAPDAFRRPADVVVAVVPALLSAYVGRLVASHAGAPLGVIVQDVMSTAAAQSGIRGGVAASALVNQLERHAMRGADGVVTIHPRLASSLHAAFSLRDRPEVIYNWSRTPRVAAAEPHKWRKRLGWADDELVVLHSGNMGLKQGLDVVLEAGGIAARAGSRVRFVLAGGGNQFRRLRTLAEGIDTVDVMPGVDSDDYASFLAAADLLLVSERAGMVEMSLPSKLTSYFASGLPVVAAVEPLGATAAFLEDSRASAMVQAGDAPALLAVVHELSKDVNRRARMGFSGSKFARENLRSEASLEAYRLWIEGLARA